MADRVKLGDKPYLKMKVLFSNREILAQASMACLIYCTFLEAVSERRRKFRTPPKSFGGAGARRIAQLEQLFLRLNNHSSGQNPQLLGLDISLLVLVVHLL